MLPGPWPSDEASRVGGTSEQRARSGGAKGARRCEGSPPSPVRGETDADNLQLRCRAHNAHEAECYVGAAPLAARR
jgi:hypothetical protein